MNATIPRPHALYIRPMSARSDASPHAAPPPSTSTEVAIRAHLREKGRMTLQQIIDCIGDRTASGETAHSSRAIEAMERLVDIGAVDLRNGRYSTLFGPNRDYDPEARERAKEAATTARCAIMIDREKVKANQRRLLKMEGK